MFFSSGDSSAYLFLLRALCFASVDSLAALCAGFCNSAFRSAYLAAFAFDITSFFSGDRAARLFLVRSLSFSFIASASCVGSFDSLVFLFA